MNIWNLRGVTSGAIRNISDAGNIEMAGAAADKQLGGITQACLRRPLLYFYSKSSGEGIFYTPF